MFVRFQETWPRDYSKQFQNPDNLQRTMDQYAEGLADLTGDQLAVAIPACRAGCFAIPTIADIRMAVGLGRNDQGVAPQQKRYDIETERFLKRQREAGERSSELTGKQQFSKMRSILHPRTAWKPRKLAEISPLAAFLGHDLALYSHQRHTSAQIAPYSIQP